VEAGGVKFSRAPGAIALEFTIDGPGFQRWVAQQGQWDERWRAFLQPIATTYEITRSWKGNRLPDSAALAKINRGLYLEDRSAGGSLQVVYDLEAGKVYLYETSSWIWDP
jgi:hypothetical protein